MIKKSTLVKLYGRVCWICGSRIAKGKLTRDHVIPRSKGGSDHSDNLRPAHKSCNQERGNDDAPATRYGVPSR